MIRKFYLLFLCTAFFICFSTVTANADVIFSDIPSSGNLYNASSGFLGALGEDIVNPFGPTTPAAQFTAGGTGSINVTQIDVAVDQRFYGSTTYPGTFQVKIWTSSYSSSLGFDIPTGAALYTSGNLTPTGEWGQQHGLVSISGITEFSLTGGNVYFMTVNVVDDLGDVSWYQNVFAPNPKTGLLLMNGHLNNDLNNPLVWNVIGNPGYLPAFDIIGTVPEPPTGAPEPATMLLLGLGMVGLAGVRRFKK